MSNDEWMNKVLDLKEDIEGKKKNCKFPTYTLQFIILLQNILTIL